RFSRGSLGPRCILHGTKLGRHGCRPRSGALAAVGFRRSDRLVSPSPVLQPVLGLREVQQPLRVRPLRVALRLERREKDSYLWQLPLHVAPGSLSLGLVLLPWVGRPEGVEVREGVT